MKVTHIAAHMGAGAGKAIAGLAIRDFNNTHRVVLLQEPNKMNHINACKEAGVEVVYGIDEIELQSEVRNADVVVVNWWHHPSVFEALLMINQIPTRMVVWNHINGLKYPRISLSLLNEFEGCLFTSEASFQNESWSDDDRELIKNKSELVYGMGDFSPYEYREKKDYGLDAPISIGYVGSLDYAKIHPEIVKWMRRAIEENNSIRFFIAGDVLPEIVEEVKTNGIERYVNFLGYRSDVNEMLLEFDVFAYILNPDNFATTENALLEAMAVGLPLVVSDGVVERAIVEDGLDGILVQDEESFVQALNKLMQDQVLRERLGVAARANVIEKYDITDNIRRFQRALDRAMEQPKRRHLFSDIFGVSAYDWFLSGCNKEERSVFNKVMCCGEGVKEADRFYNEIRKLGKVFVGQEKGSIHQFYRLYPDEDRLRRILEKIGEID